MIPKGDPLEGKVSNPEWWGNFRIGMIVAFVVIGLILAIFEGDRASKGANIPWRDVSLPGGLQPTSFVLGEHNALTVMTAQGGSFVRWWDGKDSGWEEAGGELTLPVLCNETFLDDEKIRQPPGVVLQSIDCQTAVHPDSYTYLRHVILENGQIWEWQRTAGIGEGLGGLAIILVFIVMFAGAGFMVGALASVVVQWSVGLTRKAFVGREKMLRLREEAFVMYVGIMVTVGFLVLFYLLVKGIVLVFYRTG